MWRKCGRGFFIDRGGVEIVIKLKEVAYSQRRAQFSVLVNFRSIRITIRKLLKLLLDSCGAAQMGCKFLDPLKHNQINVVN